MAARICREKKLFLASKVTLRSDSHVRRTEGVGWVGARVEGVSLAVVTAKAACHPELCLAPSVTPITV